MDDNRISEAILLKIFDQFKERQKENTEAVNKVTRAVSDMIIHNESKPDTQIIKDIIESHNKDSLFCMENISKTNELISKKNDLIIEKLGGIIGRLKIMIAVISCVVLIASIVSTIIKYNTESTVETVIEEYFDDSEEKINKDLQKQIDELRKLINKEKSNENIGKN